MRSTTRQHDPHGQMAKTWLKAAGLTGIPSAFLVDTKGVIAWIGHPMELQEQVIEDVIAGTYNSARSPLPPSRNSGTRPEAGRSGG